MTAPTSVTIVINTVSRANLLRRTLQSLKYLAYDHFEVVVVNGPSTDNTDQVLKLVASDIKVGHCPDLNLSQSRNIGIAMSDSELIAFLDDDAIPEPNWLTDAVNAFDADEVAAVGGKVYDRTGYSFQYQYSTADRCGNASWQLTRPSPYFCYPKSYEFPYLQGTNAIYRRSALLEIGGFDEEYEYYLDETDVCLRLIDAGYALRQLSNAFVHHKSAPSMIRDDQITRLFFPVVKNKIYFAHRHASKYKTLPEIDRDNLAFIQKHREHVHHNLFAGLMRPADRISFEQDALLAWSRAVDAATSPAKLIKGEFLVAHRSAFKPFPVLLARFSRLTVVLLCEDYPPGLVGGIARFTHAKACAIAAQGHNVHVIARSSTTNSVEFEDGVWVHRMVAQSQPQTEQARSLNIPQHIWDQSQSFLDEIDRIGLDQNIDVVESPIWGVPGIAVILSRRYRVITSLQTTLKLSLDSRPDLLGNPEVIQSLVVPLIALECVSIAESDHVWAISKNIAEKVESAYQHKFDPARLSIFHLGLPDWAHEPLLGSGLNATGKHLKLLFVGRLEKRKGIDILLRSAPLLCARHPHLQIDIVGDDTIPGDDGEPYKTSFVALHPSLIDSQVYFHGKLTDEAMKKMYASCDIFVAPSRFESFGLIYLEAMMFAKPIIACMGSGASEVVIDGKTGFLAKPGDSDSLFACLEKLIADPALRREFGRQGRQRYEEQFTPNQMADRSLEMYRTCISTDARRRSE